MRADNSRHLTKAARVRAEQTRRRAVTTMRRLTRTGQPLTVATVAEQAAVSRSWLYTQADLLDQIRQERPQSSSTTVAPARQADRDTSLTQRLQLAHQRIRELQADNQQLRDALAQALGDQRMRHVREPVENPVGSTRPQAAAATSSRTRPPRKTAGQRPNTSDSSR